MVTLARRQLSEKNFREGGGKFNPGKDPGVAALLENARKKLEEYKNFKYPDALIKKQEATIAYLQELEEKVKLQRRS